MPKDEASPGRYDELRVLAESYADAQTTRISIENRVRSATIPADVVTEVLEAQRHSEHLLALAMRRSFRRANPAIAAWVKNTPGVGEHLVARLLGAIGDPVIATPHHWDGDGADRVLVADEPFERNVAKLWAYCGYGDPARRRRKGMTADDAMALGSPHAKKIVYLISLGTMKCTGTDTAEIVAKPGCVPRRRSPYRDVYEEGRLRYADREGWTAGHQHQAALRLVSKAFLRDLWIAAR